MDSSAVKSSQTLRRDFFFNRILDLSEERREIFVSHEIEKILPAGETEVLTSESLKLELWQCLLVPWIYFLRIVPTI